MFLMSFTGIIGAFYSGFLSKLIENTLKEEIISDLEKN